MKLQPWLWRRRVGREESSRREDFSNGNAEAGKKRANERRLSILRSSVESVSGVKRRCHLAASGNMADPHGSLAMARSPQHFISNPQSRNTGARRGDLFGGSSIPQGDAIQSQQNLVQSLPTQPTLSYAQALDSRTQVAGGLNSKGNTPARGAFNHGNAGKIHDSQDEKASPSFEKHPREFTDHTTDASPNRTRLATAAPWGDMENDESDQSDNDIELSELDEAKATDPAYLTHRKWKKRVIKETVSAFEKVKEHTGDIGEDEVEAEHVFDFNSQARIQARKHKLEDCGIVFCTIDMSPSRDTFLQWLYSEVENKAAVQVRHVKVLAAKHYLVYTRSTEDRDLILASGPYYMRRRLIYTVPWEPGFDTSKALAKKMSVWLDLLNVDAMLEGEGKAMLSTLGQVIQMAGMTEAQEGKFQHIRGCILMDLSKPLPTVLKLNMNGVTRKIKIQYDMLPDACYVCNERGHYQRFCPKLMSTKTVVPEIPTITDPQDGFIEVRGKPKPPSENPSVQPVGAAPNNPYAPLQTLEEDDSTPTTDPNIATSEADPELDNEQMEDGELQQDEAQDAATSPHRKEIEGGDPPQDEAQADTTTLHRKEKETLESTNAEENISEEAETLLDLNHTPKPTGQSQAELKQIERQKKKDKKKAQKEERRKIRAAKISPPRPREAVTIQSEGEDSETETGQKDKFWHNSTGKKAKGSKETMDTSLGWTTSPSNRRQNIQQTQ
ncbi:hypothetical protein R1sor_018894 [Riccia sorocarpa]|uniref:CCHC-type domain-containing protein n=1 Tax=Riccia sorocarpa TaxID=122646 RepID=A0ABD3IF74_9MARC